MSRHPLRRSLGRRTAAAVFVVVTAVTLPACSEDDPEPSAGDEVPDVRGSEDLDDVFNGPYSADLREDLEGYDGQEITVEGTVDRVLSPVAFTLGPPDGDDAEPVLVVVEEAATAPEAGEDVVVAATAQDEFRTDEVGAELDLLEDDETFEEWEGDPYLRASLVEPAPAG